MTPLQPGDTIACDRDAELLGAGGYAEVHQPTGLRTGDTSP